MFGKTIKLNIKDNLSKLITILLERLIYILKMTNMVE